MHENMMAYGTILRLCSEKVCKDVEAVEPHLLPIDNEAFDLRSTVTSP